MFSYSHPQGRGGHGHRQRLCDQQLLLASVCFSGFTAQASANGPREALWLFFERVGAYRELAQGSR